MSMAIEIINPHQLNDFLSTGVGVDIWATSLVGVVDGVEVFGVVVADVVGVVTVGVVEPVGAVVEESVDDVVSGVVVDESVVSSQSVL
jgi:hypothetical protein